VADLQNAAAKLFVFIMAVNIGMYAMEVSGIIPNLTFPQTGATFDDIKNDFPNLGGTTDISSSVFTISTEPKDTSSGIEGPYQLALFLINQVPKIITYYSRILSFIVDLIPVGPVNLAVGILFGIINLVIMIVLALFSLTLLLKGIGALGGAIGSFFGG
jgi:hypothetical protein|tara:strand:+ start:18367 stop:18843 length:477 start_codon:yes stop_codon:yes gene_type:complete